MEFNLWENGEWLFRVVHYPAKFKKIGVGLLTLLVGHHCGTRATLRHQLIVDTHLVTAHKNNLTG